MDITQYYAPAHLDCFEEIRSTLYEQHKVKLNPTVYNAGVGEATFMLPWTRANFPILYDEINKSHKVIYARFFIMEPGAKLYPHMDTRELSMLPYALNIPIRFEEENQLMKWFRYDEVFEKSKNPIFGLSSSPADYSKLTEVESFQLTTPHYVKIGIFHSVANFGTTTRIVLSLRFIDSFDV